MIGLRAGRIGFVAAVAFGLALVGSVRAARADGGAVECVAEGGGWTARAALPGRVTGFEAVRDGERVVVALRVLVRRRERVWVGEAGADGAWAVIPREVSALGSARPGSALALVAAHGVRELVRVSRGRVTTVVLGASAEEDRVAEIAAPVRRAGEPLLGSDGASATIAWAAMGRLRVQRVTAGETSASAVVEARLPERTVAVSIAPGGASDATGVVVRTPGRRYFVAVMDADGAVHWPRNGPAGCDERGRCPAVRLLRAPGGGYVATWAGRPTDDGLAVFGARAIDANGHARGRAVAFVPVVRGMMVVGPGGQGMMLQLSRPMVLRGAWRPASVPTDGLARDEFPVSAHAWPVDELGPGLEVVAATSTGAIVDARLRCGEAPDE